MCFHLIKRLHKCICKSAFDKNSGVKQYLQDLFHKKEHFLRQKNGEAIGMKVFLASVNNMTTDRQVCGGYTACDVTEDFLRMLQVFPANSWAN